MLTKGNNSILGTPFYLMEYVKGVVLKDAALPGLLPDQKKKVMDTFCEVLHKIHKIDFKKLGLESLGSKGEIILIRSFLKICHLSFIFPCNYLIFNQGEFMQYYS